MSKPADFWSRRKAAVVEEQAAEVKVREEAEIAEERARLEEKTDAEILDELGLKDPDEMQAGDDFAAFLKAAVPDRLRRRALRRLWLSNPVLANLDSLVDYGEDYTDAATVVENLQTAIRLGRGALQRAEEQIADASVEEPPAPTVMPEPLETDSFSSETVPDPSCDTVEDEAGPGEAESGLESERAGEHAAPPDEWAAADVQTPRPRRMKFHFLD